jgi:hypothetical protein
MVLTTETDTCAEAAALQWILLMATLPGGLFISFLGQAPECVEFRSAARRLGDVGMRQLILRIG